MYQVRIQNIVSQLMNVLHANRYSKNTIRAYKRDLEDFLDYLKQHFSDVQYVHELSSCHLTHYQHCLKNKSCNHEISASTLDRKIYSLKSLCSILYQNKIVPQNICENIYHKKSSKKDIPPYLSAEELDLLLLTVQQYGGANAFRDLALLAAFRYLGAKQSELLKLKWEDVDLTLQIVSLHRKNGSTSPLKIHPKLYEALFQLFQSLDNKLVEYVFLSQKGNPLSKQACNDVLSKYVALLGLKKDFTINTSIFRHSFIVHCIKKGVPTTKIQSYTGHSDIADLAFYQKVCVTKKLNVIHSLD